MQLESSVAQARAEALQRELVERAVGHAKKISDLKFKIAMAEAEL
jgi:hypothetical protein